MTAELQHALQWRLGHGKIEQTDKELEEEEEKKIVSITSNHSYI